MTICSWDPTITLWDGARIHQVVAGARACVTQKSTLLSWVCGPAFVREAPLCKQNQPFSVGPLPSPIVPQFRLLRCPLV